MPQNLGAFLGGNLGAARPLSPDRKWGLRWFQSSAEARRGFCGNCGASLFWELQGEGRISIAAGALEGETGLHIAQHWHREDKGDYYAIPDT